ncbi:MAG: phage portal protein, partial [Acidimicrobiia bacterium]|nr:phage portal protein [Acidimicrobiia bacterium]
MGLLANIFTPDIGATSFKDPAEWLLHSFGGKETTSGVRVSADSSLSLSVYYACIRNISEDIAKLPLRAFTPVGAGREAEPEHPVSILLNERPNEEMTAMSFRTLMTHWALGWGGAIAKIERVGNDVPVGLWPIHPSRIQLERTASGMLRYRVRADKDSGLPGKWYLDQDDVLHIHGLGGGTTGYSVVEYASDSIGLGLAAQRFGASFFGNNAALGGVLEHPEKLSDEAFKHIRSSFTRAYAGPDNAGKVAILEEGMKYSSRTIPNDQAQFIESRKFQIPEICRWFRMPPHKVQDLE